MASKLLELIPTMQSISLLKSNIKDTKKKKFKPVKNAVKNIVGIEMIKFTGGLVKWVIISDQVQRVSF